MHDQRDGEDLYRVLRDEVIPLYYQRDRDGLPRGWIQRMKRTIRTLGWRFNADRMVMDYTQKCYVPAPGARPATSVRRSKHPSSHNRTGGRPPVAPKKWGAEAPRLETDFTWWFFPRWL